MYKKSFISLLADQRDFIEDRRRSLIIDIKKAKDALVTAELEIISCEEDIMFIQEILDYAKKISSASNNTEDDSQ